MRDCARSCFCWGWRFAGWPWRNRLPRDQSPEPRATTSPPATACGCTTWRPGRAARTHLLFVPGWTMPAWIWAPQIAAFSRAVPRRGLRSARPGRLRDRARPATSRAAAARTSPNCIAHLGPAPVVVVGWSLGVLDTLAYVHTHGDAQLAGLVLVDNSVGEEPPPIPVPPQPHPGPPPPHDVAMRRFVRGMFRRPQNAGLSRPADRGDAAHAGSRLPRAAGLSGAAHLLARGGLCHRQAGAVRRAPRLRGAGGEPAAQAAEHRDGGVRRRRPRAVRRRRGAVQRAAGRISSSGAIWP